MHHRRYVNVYSIDRLFGGPEEGGWWYDTGTPVLTVMVEHPEKCRWGLVVRFCQGQGWAAVGQGWYWWWEDAGHIAQSYQRGPFTTRNAARAAARVSWLDEMEGDIEAIVSALTTIYPDTGKRNSVLGGEDYVVWIEDGPGVFWPNERPRYE